MPYRCEVVDLNKTGVRAVRLHEARREEKLHLTYIRSMHAHPFVPVQLRLEYCRALLEACLLFLGNIQTNMIEWIKTCGTYERLRREHP